MALGSIVIDLLLKTGAFNNDAKLAERRLDELGKTAKRAGAVIGVALAGAVTAAAASIKSAIDRMDDMSKAAQRAQLPTEQFSQLSYAASLADVSTQDLTTSFGRLARAQADAARGSKEQEGAFARLGIEFKNADGTLRNSRDVFLDFADVYRKFKGSPEVLATGMQIFGRSFQNLIPLLKDGREGLQAASDEADRLGVTLSTEAGQKAEEFNDNLTRLSASVQGLWQGVASDLLPRLNELALRLNSQDFRDGFGSIINGAVTAAKVLADLAVTTANVMKFLGEEVAARVGGVAADDLVRQEQAIERMRRRLAEFDQSLGSRGGPMEGYDPTTGAGARARNPTIDKYRQELKEMEAALERNRAMVASLNSMPKAPKFDPSASGVLDAGTGALRIQSPSASKPKAPKKSEEDAEAERLASAYESLNEALQRSILLHGETSNAARVNYEIQHGGLKALSPELEKVAREQAAWLDQLEDMAALEGVWDAAAQEQTARMIESWSEATDEISVFADQAARNAQTAFADFLFDPFEDGVSGMVKGFSEAIRRMLAEAAAAKLFEMLGAAMSGYTGTGSSFINGVGGALSGKRATGGPVYPGGTFLVGENGPELLHMGGNTGAITPNNRIPSLGGGGGPVKVEVVNNGAPVSAQASTQKMPDGSQLIRLVLNAVGESFASGSGAPYVAVKRRFGLREVV